MGKSYPSIISLMLLSMTHQPHIPRILQLPMPSRMAVQRGEIPSMFLAAGARSALQKRICTQWLIGWWRVVLVCQQLSSFKPLFCQQRYTYASRTNRCWQDKWGDCPQLSMLPLSLVLGLPVLLHGGDIFQEVVWGGGAMENDDNNGHYTMATTMAVMIILEHIDKVIVDTGARYLLRPNDAMALYNMRLVSLLSSLFYLVSSLF
jgi:hypothetical protein